MKKLLIALLMLVAGVAQAGTYLQHDTVTLDSANDTLDYYFRGGNTLIPGPNEAGWSVEIKGLTGSGTITSFVLEPLLSSGNPPSDTSHEVTLWSSESITTSTELIEAVGSLPRCYGVRIIIVETGTGTMKVTFNYGTD